MSPLYPEHTATPRHRPEVILSRFDPHSAASINSISDSSLSNSLSPLSLSPAGPSFADPLGHQTPLPFLPTILSCPGPAAALHRGELKGGFYRRERPRSPQMVHVPGHASGLWPERLQRSHAIRELISEDYSPVFSSLSFPFINQ